MPDFQTTALRPGETMADWQRIYDAYANGGIWDPIGAQGAVGGVYDAQGQYQGIMTPPRQLGGGERGGPGSSGTLNAQTGMWNMQQDTGPLGMSDVGFASLMGMLALSAGVGGGLAFGGAAPAIAANTLARRNLRSICKPLTCNRVRLAPDGEIDHVTL